ncbi:hypothetical protein PRIPAC_89932 [Pristionchus pacificus]|nr:hypothetical protein PRIPAC_89932 [Pristionchus pacificus]
MAAPPANELVQLKEGEEIGKFAVVKKLGEGGFGAVYMVKDEENEELHALKVESMTEPLQMLKLEVVVLMELNRTERPRHFCEIFGKGQKHNFNYLVMTLVGKSLQDLRTAAPLRRFSMGTALSVGQQCLEAIMDLHQIGYLHRDIKPANYTVGRRIIAEERKVYMLDFGMARKYIKDDGTLRNPRKLAGFRGTVKYAPIACHIQREQCRKDDIESWLYMVVELVRGHLPWRNIPDPKDVGQKKKDCRKEKYKELFGGCPRKLMEVFPILDNGKFFDTPDYAAITALCKEAIIICGVQEFPYDWEQ